MRGEDAEIRVAHARQMLGSSSASYEGRCAAMMMAVVLLSASRAEANDASRIGVILASAQEGLNGGRLAPSRGRMMSVAGKLKQAEPTTKVAHWRRRAGERWHEWLPRAVREQRFGASD